MEVSNYIPVKLRDSSVFSQFAMVLTQALALGFDDFNKALKAVWGPLSEDFDLAASEELIGRNLKLLRNLLEDEQRPGFFLLDSLLRNRRGTKDTIKFICRTMGFGVYDVWAPEDIDGSIEGVDFDDQLLVVVLLLGDYTEDQLESLRTVLEQFLWVCVSLQIDVLTEMGWEIDSESDYQPSVAGVGGFWEEDGNGDLQPVTGSELDYIWQADPDDDLQPI